MLYYNIFITIIEIAVILLLFKLIYLIYFKKNNTEKFLSLFTSFLYLVNSIKQDSQLKPSDLLLYRESSVFIGHLHRLWSTEPSSSIEM